MRRTPSLYTWLRLPNSRSTGETLNVVSGEQQKSRTGCRQGRYQPVFVLVQERRHVSTEIHDVVAAGIQADQGRFHRQGPLELIGDDVAEPLAPHGQVRVVASGFGFRELFRDSVSPPSYTVGQVLVRVSNALGERITEGDVPPRCLGHPDLPVPDAQLSAPSERTFRDNFLVVFDQ
jgi:hypothetical protein